MCGRYTVRTASHVKLPGVRNSELPFAARYNVAPTQEVPVIADFGGGLELTTIVWGLLPRYSNDGKRFINARAETIESKTSFSDSFRRRRCLILADGFFEWQRSFRSKQAHYIHMTDESTFAFAGIWDDLGTAERSRSCAIITTTANATLKPIHERMPVILRPESYRVWLDPQTPLATLRELLVPFPAANLSSHPVSRQVNSVENDSPELIKREDHEVGTNLTLF